MADIIMPNRRHVMAGIAASAAVPLPAAAAPAGTRRRLPLNDGWRFAHGDPAGVSGLDYDVRPEVLQSADGKAADAKPDEAVKVDAAGRQVLKAWILPTANPFIADPARRHQRPAAAPAFDVPYLRGDFDDSGWDAVTLPHDWAIAGPFLETGPYGGMGRLKTWGAVWYRRALEVTADDAGKVLYLDIDGAMSYAAVWVNGVLVGGWPYGYASWRLDLTAHVKPGRNQIAIRLDNPPESARWYPGAGLYRNVWLTKVQPVHVGHWGTFVTTPQVSKASATVDVAVTVRNASNAPATAEVTTSLFALDGDGNKTGRAAAALPAQTLTVAPAGEATVRATTTIANPRLWGPKPTQTPHLYAAVTTVRLNGKVADSYETPFGIRELRFDADQGVLVNGEHIPFKGVNNHHDLGALGAAFNVRAAERQLEILQEMGCNAIRMSHNPPDPQLLDLCDRMGLLVIDEIFDSWERKKTPLDFHLIFPDWHEPDLRALLRRDRNHPSIIMWSVGNEVGEQYTDKDGAALGRRLVAMTREEDATRPIMCAMNYAKADMPLPAEFDVIALNYQGSGIRAAPGQFPFFRQKFPDKVIFHSESAAALSSRGEYQFPVPGVNSAPVRPGSGGDPVTKQVSAYELFTADFGSSADRSWAAMDQAPYVAGEFIWSGWDYLGEPTPYYDARSSYFGIIDLAGFKKDRFWLYQSRWRPELPIAHLLPHWTWRGREGEVTPVHLFTTGDEAELFINGVSQGRKKKNPYEYRLRWDYTVYEPGEISVIAYKDGREWARSSVRTAGEPARIELSCDRDRIAADGKDLSFVTARILDNDGRTAPRASNLIRFSIEGAGEIVATDNGDPASFVPFPSHERPAFNGLCLGIVRAKPGKAGRFRVTAESAGLKGASVEIMSGRG